LSRRKERNEIGLHICVLFFEAAPTPKVARDRQQMTALLSLNSGGFAQPHGGLDKAAFHGR
jgi:hypothetical protein